MIKLVALDIDGTLLNGQGRITDRTLRAIEALRARGVKFTLCTGRNMPLARRFAEELRVDVPMATCNGAEVRLLDGEVLQRLPLSPEEALKTYEILEKHGALYDIYSEDRIVIRNKREHLKQLIAYHRSIGRIDREYEAMIEQEVEQPFLFETHDLRLWLEKERPAVEKYFVMESRPAVLEAMFEELSRLAGLCVTTSHSTTLEVNGASASKGAALAGIARHCGYAREEVAAIGDGMNDLSMFEYAGLSVAMGNASDEVKARAAKVTGRNTEEGLAAALEQWIA